MTSYARCALIGIALMLSGCVSSIHPFYTEKDVVFDPALLGTWTSIDKMTLEFSITDQAHRSYRLAVTNPEKHRTEHHAVLFRLESFLFLDIVPIYARDDRIEWYREQLPEHSVLLVAGMEPTLQLAQLVRGPSDAADVPAHVKRGSGFDTQFILTVTTQELQSYLLRSVVEKRSERFAPLEFLPANIEE